METAKANLILLISFIAILFGAGVIIYFLIINNINSCTSNPLKYQADILARENNFSYSYAHFGVYKDKTDLVASATKELDLSKSKFSNPFPLP